MATKEKVMESFGRGIKGVVKDNILLLEIDLTGDYGASASGKSQTIATTSGNIPVMGDIKLGINCYRKMAR